MSAYRHVPYLWALVLGLLAVLALTSCVPPGTLPFSSRPEIGTLMVSGPQVFLNGRPARSGLTVFHGDQVTTGATSSARIDFNGGGFAQLDENTDPFWQWLQEAGRCLIEFVVRFGQVYGESGACALRMVSDEGSALIETTFHLWVIAERVHLAVLEGQVRVLSPLSEVVHSRQLAMIQGGEVGIRPLSPAQFRSLTRWREYYDFTTDTGVPPPPPRRPDGRQPTRVPSVIGMDEDTAIAVLNRAGLRVGRIAFTPTGRHQPGRIVEQRPPAGAVVSPHTPVDLLVEAPREDRPEPPQPSPPPRPDGRRRPVAPR